MLLKKKKYVYCQFSEWRKSYWRYRIDRKSLINNFTMFAWSDYVVLTKRSFVEFKSVDREDPQSVYFFERIRRIVTTELTLLKTDSSTFSVAHGFIKTVPGNTLPVCYCDHWSICYKNLTIKCDRNILFFKDSIRNQPSFYFFVLGNNIISHYNIRRVVLTWSLTNNFLKLLCVTCFKNVYLLIICFH